MGLLLLAVALYAHRPCRSRALVGAFICGLGLTNQHTLGTSPTWWPSYRGSAIGHRCLLGVVATVLYEVPVITWVLWDLHCRHLLNASCFLALAAVYVASCISRRVGAELWLMHALACVEQFLRGLLALWVPCVGICAPDTWVMGRSDHGGGYELCCHACAPAMASHHAFPRVSQAPPSLRVRHVSTVAHEGHVADV